MKLIFSPLAMEQWNDWKRTDSNIAKRIKRLLADIQHHPFTGIGKPEALRYGVIAQPYEWEMGGVGHVFCTLVRFFCRFSCRESTFFLILRRIWFARPSAH